MTGSAVFKHTCRQFSVYVDTVISIIFDPPTHWEITTVDCVDMYNSFVTLYKPTIKYFMSYYKYTLEESNEMIIYIIIIIKNFWRGFADLAKTLNFITTKLFLFYVREQISVLPGATIIH